MISEFIDQAEAETLILQTSDEDEEAQIHPPWYPGKVIEGLYRIEGEIARGGMGVVYKATDLATDNIVVIKSLLPKVAMNEEYKKRFIRESEEWVDIGTHPNIVRAYTAHEIEYLPRLALEYVAGCSLDDLLAKDELLPTDRALDIAVQICWGMAHAHDKGLIHRDLKPANVMISDDGTVKITDFGLVKRLLEVAEKQMTAEGQMPPIPTLMTHGVMGTPEYIAPEQWQEAETQSSDIYAFGIILYEMFCGRRPFDYSHLEGLERVTAYQTAHCEEPLPSPRSIQEKLPEPVEKLIMQCLQKDPAARPKSFREITAITNKMAKQIIGKSFRQEPAAEELDRHARLDQANAYLRLGNSCWFRGDYDKAVNLYERANQIFISKKDQKGQAGYFRAMGSTYIRQGFYDRGIEMFNKGIKIAEVLDDQKIISDCYGNIGVVLTLRSEYDQAIILFHKSLKIKTSLDDKTGLGNCYSCLGDISLQRGDLDQAMDMFQKCLAIMETMGDQAGISRSYLNIGNVYYQRREFDQARGMFQKSLTIKKIIGDRMGMNRCYNNLANCFTAQENHDDALKMYYKCLSIQKELNDQIGISACLHNIGTIYLEQELNERAMGFFIKALEIARNIKDKRLIAVCLSEIGRTYANLGDKDMAKAKLLESLALMKEIGYHRQDNTEKFIAGLEE
ncbi:tetratricopeptide repeat protein [Planctomycetota bacterium]